MRAAARLVVALFLSLIAIGSRAQVYTFTTFAGGSFGAMDGSYAQARFGTLLGVALDHQGNLYSVDFDNLAIRKIAPTGAVSTLAGYNPQSRGGLRLPGFGARAEFSTPHSIVADRAGNVYLVDGGIVMKATPAGEVTVVASDLGAIVIAIDGDDNLLVSCDDGSIRRIAPDRSTVTTVASIGTGARHAIAVDNHGTIYVSGDREIIKISSSGGVTVFTTAFIEPSALTVDGNGVVYVGYNYAIFKVTPQGDITTFAGAPGQEGFTDGRGAGARFAVPVGFALAGDGSLYVADGFNGCIRKVSPDGVVTTLTGGGGGGFQDGSGATAVFSFGLDPSDLNGIAADADGNLYVADAKNDAIRKIASDGVVTTFAGRPGEPGSRDDGAASRSLFRNPAGVAVDDLGNLYVADRGNRTIRKITNGSVITIAGKAGVSGNVDGMGSVARFTDPIGIAVDADRNVYVTDNQTVRVITTNGVVSTVAGMAGQPGIVDGAGSAARFSYPNGIAAGSDGTLYVVDWFSGRIRTITRSGVVKTLAGNSPSSQVFDGPTGIAADRDGNVYVADTYNGRITRVTRNGIVTPISGQRFGANRDGTGFDAGFFQPSGVVVDRAGSLFVVDIENIRKGVPALYEKASIDAPDGFVGEQKQLYGPATARTWEWKIIRYPSSSHAQLSSTTARNPTFVPDVADLYIFQATASDGVRSSISTVSLMVSPGKRQHRSVPH